MKKPLSFLLIIALLLSLTLPVKAKEKLPESSHSYSENTYETYTYSIPGAAGMLVTFSPETRVESSKDLSKVMVYPDKNGQITLENVLEAVNEKGRGDYIFLYNKDGSLIDCYQGDELSGKTVFVSGDEVKITLSSDEAGTDYGFKVTSVQEVQKERLATVTYYTGLSSTPSYQKTYYTDSNSTLDKNVIVNSVVKYKSGSGFTGWALSEGGKIAYDGGETVDASMDGLKLYACWAEPLLGTDEIFVFNNSSRYFNVGENGGYYLTDEAMAMLEKNIFCVFGPTLVPATILGTVLYTMPKWEWKGSCYGFSAVTFLQHYGKINILPSQNASCMNDMKMTDELRSTINYYQAMSAASWLCENKAGISGTREFAYCMEELYYTVESGKIVMLTFYEGAALVTIGHTVLVTDVYTNAKGEHILIVYDNNHPWKYQSGMTDRFIVSSDWKNAIDDYGDEVGAINWTADTTQFVAFDINGNGSTLIWHKAYLNHKIDVVKRVAALILRLKRFELSIN